MLEVLAEVVFTNREVPIGNYKAWLFFLFVCHFLIFLLLIYIFFINILAILLGLFVFRVHLIIEELLILFVWVTRCDHSAFLLVAA